MAPRSKPKESQRGKEKEKSRVSLSSLDRPESCKSPSSTSQMLGPQTSASTHSCQILSDPSPTILLRKTLNTLQFYTQGMAFKSVLLLVDLLWFLTLLWLPLKPSQDNLRHTYPPYPTAWKPFPTSQQCTMTLRWLCSLLYCCTAQSYVTALLSVYIFAFAVEFSGET